MFNLIIRRSKMNTKTTIDSTEKSQPQKKHRKKSKLTKTIPTGRIKFPKQTELLCAYGALSGEEGKVVTNQDVAKMTKMAKNTVSLANSFFCDTGLLSRSNGGFIPCDDVKNFHKAYRWSKEESGHKLFNTLQSTWFAVNVAQRLSLGDVSEKDLIQCLAEEANADLEHEPQLRMLIEYLVFCGMIERDGNMILLKEWDSPDTSHSLAPTVEEKIKKEDKTPKSPETSMEVTKEAISFNVNFNIPMKELEGWEPDRISSFFEGMAKTIAAQRGTEKERKEKKAEQK